MSAALRLVQVDAFTATPFAGNPAAVCFLDPPRDDVWLQAVAAEMNLAETAFLWRRDDGFALRWFTPTVEVPLCGHATLASAHALWQAGELAADQPARFHTASGELRAWRAGDWIGLDFPARPPVAGAVPAAVVAALGVRPVATTTNVTCHLVEVASEATVRALAPDLRALAVAAPDRGVVVTAPGTAPYDVVSRFFAPAHGIDEDPVTGSAHCALGVYWGPRLGKRDLCCLQASRRGGTVRVVVEPSPGRVHLFGQAVTVLRGELSS